MAEPHSCWTCLWDVWHSFLRVLTNHCKAGEKQVFTGGTAKGMSAAKYSWMCARRVQSSVTALLPFPPSLPSSEQEGASSAGAGPLSVATEILLIWSQVFRCYLSL